MNLHDIAVFARDLQEHDSRRELSVELEQSLLSFLAFTWAYLCHNNDVPLYFQYQITGRSLSVACCIDFAHMFLQEFIHFRLWSKFQDRLSSRIVNDAEGDRQLLDYLNEEKKYLAIYSRLCTQ